LPVLCLPAIWLADGAGREMVMPTPCAYRLWLSSDPARRPCRLDLIVRRYMVGKCRNCVKVLRKINNRVFNRIQTLVRNCLARAFAIFTFCFCHFTLQEIHTMQIAIPAERLAGEKRVAATPETVKKLVAMGHTVVVEQGAGQFAAAPDAAYVDVGASIAPDRAQALAQADIVLTVRPLDEAGIAELKTGAVLIGQLAPIRTALSRSWRPRRFPPLPWSCCRVPRVRRAWTCCPARTTLPVTRRCCWLPITTRVSCPC
jgi:hypothetical protein